VNLLKPKKLYTVTNTHPTYANEEDKERAYNEFARKLVDVYRRAGIGKYGIKV
jgi:hypothetical protein